LQPGDDMPLVGFIAYRVVRKRPLLHTGTSLYVRLSSVIKSFLADRTNGRAIGTVLRLSVVCL